MVTVVIVDVVADHGCDDDDDGGHAAEIICSMPAGYNCTKGWDEDAEVYEGGVGNCVIFAESSHDDDDDSCGDSANQWHG